MPPIGETLREARMRQKLGIADIEERTKIRAKYLRALENEEWDLLPGPTYVRSFLRTYADALDLDSKVLVEEYKVRHEPMEAGELNPIRRPPPRERARGGAGGGTRRGLPRGALVGLVLVGILVLLLLVGRDAERDDAAGPAAVATMPGQDDAPATTGRDATEEPERERPPARPRAVRLQLRPTGPVSVCLVDARGRALIANQILQAGSTTRTYRSRRFELVLGNNAVRLRINGRNRSVPASSEAIGYAITRRGRAPLAVDRRPSCE